LEKRKIFPGFSSIQVNGKNLEVVSLEDTGILDLYFRRSEQAIVETDAKYGGYCYSIAYNILSSREDAQETVSDTYLAAWNNIPPQRPGLFGAFLGKITRHLSIDRWRRSRAGKRGGGEVAAALEELGECAGRQDVQGEYERKELLRAIDRFLASLPPAERNVFLCRYWYLDPVRAIAQATGFSQGKVTSMLHRTREKLRRELEKEGYL